MPHHSQSIYYTAAAAAAAKKSICNDVRSVVSRDLNGRDVSPDGRGRTGRLKRVLSGWPSHDSIAIIRSILRINDLSF